VRGNIVLDVLTLKIYRFLKRLKIPFIAELYIKHYRLWNFMVVGASGTVLNWLLYEGIFRPLFHFATLIGMVISTFIVFYWNYFWNKVWTFRSEVKGS
jgi:putative flippase GtrA